MKEVRMGGTFIIPSSIFYKVRHFQSGENKREMRKSVNRGIMFS